MHVHVILNPRADRGRAHQLKDKLLAWGQGLGRLTLETTARPGHAAELAQQAAAAGCDVVVAAGGDGTIHEVINGLVGGGYLETPLGVIPIGSGNDFAYAFGLPLADPQAALQRIFNGAPQPIDLALLTDDRGRRLVVDNAVGIGFDAAVAVEASAITRFYGFVAYLVATLRVLAMHYDRPQLTIRYDDQTLQQRAIMMTIGLGPRTGGGFLITPDARHNDGLLDTCLVDPVSRLTILRLLPRVMKGTHITSPHIKMLRHRQVTIQSDAPLAIHTDGEIFARLQDNVRQVTISCMPAALRLIS